ncbi:hypothetical protein J6590_038844 [Homalodisca vitripennis]|nr:hypothetical protein J6590_038844 [Homalodisca vitripennis]
MSISTRHQALAVRRRRRAAHKFPPDSPTPDTRRPRRTTLRRAIVSYWGFHTVRRAPHGPTSSLGFATGDQNMGAPHGTRRTKPTSCENIQLPRRAARGVCRIVCKSTETDCETHTFVP